MRAVLSALQGLRVPLVKEERELHALIAQALAGEGIAFEKEVPLGAFARVDFLCGSIAVEAKKGKPDRRALLAQLGRYADSPRVSGLVLVAERSAALPQTLRGKPLYLVVLNRLWGVAL